MYRGGKNSAKIFGPAKFSMRHCREKFSQIYFLAEDLIALAGQKNQKLIAKNRFREFHLDRARMLTNVPGFVIRRVAVTTITYLVDPHSKAWGWSLGWTTWEYSTVKIVSYLASELISAGNFDSNHVPKNASQNIGAAATKDRQRSQCFPCRTFISISFVSRSCFSVRHNTTALIHKTSSVVVYTQFRADLKTRKSQEENSKNCERKRSFFEEEKDLK